MSISVQEKLVSGNWLIYHTVDKEDIFCQLDAQDVFNIATRYMEADQTHSPIPLSEDILLKCGLKDTYLIKNDISIWVGVSKQINCVTYYRISYSGHSGEHCFKYVAYLHDLQNLIFALTGTELNITL